MFTGFEHRDAQQNPRGKGIWFLRPLRKRWVKLPAGDLLGIY